jgi:uncharacterized membrane protein
MADRRNRRSSKEQVQRDQAELAAFDFTATAHRRQELHGDDPDASARDTLR